ncbi:MAG: hypothetical protein ACTTJF_00265 [Campylobacter sp.]|uniref:hypothetical protein n=1 Tax=Campylobacter sp. TaxID=205 RepID=UPI003FA13FFB
MTTNKTRGNSAKSKGRDKDLEAFDNNKTDKTNARAEAVEAFISDFLKSSFWNNIEKAFFTKMIDDVKSGEIDGFTMDDFYFLLKINNTREAAERVKFELFLYFKELCIIAEQDAKQKDEKELILSFENYKKAVGIIGLTLPRGFSCKSLEELQEIKNGIEQANKEGKAYLHRNLFHYEPDHTKALETTAYYCEFLKRMDAYFYDNPVISHYLDKQRHIQNVKDQFRDELRSLDVYYSAKAAEAIDSGTLTQSICNYVMKNFADFLAEYEKTENDFRKSDK